MKDYIEKIVNNGKQEDMERLSIMFEELLDEVKETKPHMYKKFKDKLYCMAYGAIINDDMRKDIVNKIGEHWTLEETEQVRTQSSLLNIRPNEFNVVMNMAYSDYKDVFGDDLETYVKFSKAFIEDSDAIDGKVYYYFETIVK